VSATPPPKEGFPTPEPARSLVVWGGGSTSVARTRHREGAEIVAWPGSDPAPLIRDDVPVRPLEAVIGEEGLAAAEAAGRTWARLWGRVPLLDGRCFRDLVPWRDTSLLWLTEGFIHKETAGPACARLAETVLRLLEVTRADEVDVGGLGRSEVLLLGRACTTRGVLLHGPAQDARPMLAPPPRRRSPARLLATAFAPTAPPSLPEAAAGGETRGAPLIAIAPGAGDAAPLRPLLEAAARQLGMAAVLVPLDLLRSWETRAVRRRISEAETLLRECRSRLRDSPGLHESYSHRGVGFADLAGNDLDRILLGHLPTAVRILEAAVELLAGAPRPRLVLLSGVHRDARRALLGASGAAGVPAVVVHDRPVTQEDADRTDGGPRATDTILWEPDTDPTVVVDRLREAARARVRAS
jgi:hypothetical protein